MNPHSNIRSARNIAVYIIKLTDRHIQIIYEKTMKLARMAHRATVQSKEINEFTYFMKNDKRDFGNVEDFEKNFG
jgi:histone H3/H4